MLLRVRARGSDPGREVDTQAVVLCAVVDLGLDVDACDARIQTDARDDLATDELLGATLPILREALRQWVGHANFEGVAGRALFKHAHVRRRKG